MRRVVVTGAGTVNALGRDVPATLTAMRDGRSAIGALELRDLDRLDIRIGAQVKGFDPGAHFDRGQLTLFDRYTQFAVLAAREAMAQAAPGLSEGDALRAGVILGTSGGGLQTQDDNYRAVYEAGKNRVHPFTVPKLMNSAAAAHLSMEWGLKGPSFTVSSACASSNHAIAQAALAIRAGQADVMLTGGAEAMLCFGGVKAWEGLRVMSRDTCRPFCATRSGMVQGEGAAVFVLEDYERARARGAEILAEIAGAAMSSDAADIVQPAQDGAARAMAGALRDAGLAAEDVGYVNAHGTGTTANDRVETAAIREVFGPAADRLAVSSTKAMHGHCIGATGAIELLACLMALREGVIAPTANWQAADPACDLDVVPNTARRSPVRACLSNAFAFGGMNAVLALKAV
ncbi:beta-ketoacyl-[acyl-carrier-protein] synthase family protein [Jannaschia ovalis]|uniref:Nodulation protein E n=1 Tax=Jannaschia ovalis TaxID=3038773 RepID=A0ABY8LD18_9RHOB|nr:beta-ketoacyl-[acyl-carrier-protein] synthase family protein [Jannaschia sp. GRR-S6-38]WGH78497.1 beta-ketoacyl-[acyl-carrier-protein] synthase family protein [Jannaschia sp. GRR-S6-38]